MSSQTASATAAMPAAQKFLSYSAILTLAANTMNGPGITTLPDVATDAGLSLYVILITGSVIMASFVCRRMVYAMWSSLRCGGGGYSSVKDVEEQTVASEDTPLVQSNGSNDSGDNDNISSNNSNLAPQPSLEKTSIVGQSLEAYGKNTSVYAALTMVASALCLALAQMMLCAAILDGMLVSTMGQSCALGLPASPTSSWIHCTSHSSMKPYAGSGAPTSLISIGTVIAAVISVGMGTVDLDEMMGVQYSLFGCLIVSCIRFAYVLRHMSSELSDGGGVDVVAADEGIAGNAEDLSWFVGPNPFSTIGPIMFNFAFVVTAPPLVAMAKKESIAYKALGMACVAMGVLYTLVGCDGAPVANAVRNGLVEGGDDTNLLSLILLSGKVGSGSTGRPSMIDLFCIGTFGLSTVASVPVYCLLAKDTLVNDAGVAPMTAFLLSNVLPWLLVALTYNAAFFEAFVNWSGLLILGYSNFSLPLLLDVKLKKVRAFLRPSDQDSGITSAVFSFLTASITAVIAISITDSLSVASLSFGAVLMATMWPSGSD
jgi:hypothetical protein